MSKEDVITIEEIEELDASDKQPFSIERKECMKDGKKRLLSFVVGADGKYHLQQTSTKAISQLEDLNESFKANGMLYKLYKYKDGDLHMIRQYQLDKKDNPIKKEVNGHERAYPNGWLKFTAKSKDKLIELVEGVKGD